MQDTTDFTPPSSPSSPPSASLFKATEDVPGGGGAGGADEYSLFGSMFASNADASDELDPQAAASGSIDSELESFRALREQPLRLRTELASHVPNIGDTTADQLQLILLWWKYIGQQRFPNVAIVARVHLGALPTEANVERVFPVIGNVLSNRRTSMLPADAEALVFTHAHLDTIDSLIADGTLDERVSSELRQGDSENEQDSSDSN